MPSLERYPDHRDVEALMKSASYWPADDKPARQTLAREQAATGALAAREEWERATGWTPFLVAPNTPFTTREFDLDSSSPVTQFDGGALEISSVAINGQALDAGLWRALPRNAPANGRPFQALAWTPHVMRRFASRNRGFWAPPVITVTARWGYCTLCPADAWQQILQAAGLVTLTQIENFQSVASISQEGFSKAYDVVGIISQKDLAQIWKKGWDATAAKYRRMII